MSHYDEGVTREIPRIPLALLRQPRRPDRALVGAAAAAIAGAACAAASVTAILWGHHTVADIRALAPFIALALGTILTATAALAAVLLHDRGVRR